MPNKCSFLRRLFSWLIEIKSNFGRKKLGRANQGSNFLGSSFTNGNNVRAPVQFRRERQSQHLKRFFFQKNDSAIFPSTSTRIIRPVKRNTALTFFSININKSLTASSNIYGYQAHFPAPALKNFPYKTFLCFFLKKPAKSFLCFLWKSFSNFQKTELSYISGKVYSEPCHI